MFNVVYLVGIVTALVAGLLLGFLLRNRKRVNLDKVTFGIIIALIFSLGFSIGSNNELLSSFPKIGVNAVVILVLSVFFSVVFVKAARKLVKIE